MFGKKKAEIRMGTLLGEGCECNGDVTAKGSIRVDGKINGDLTSDGTIIVGSTGSVSGNLTAEAVMIGGEVLGNIYALEKAELTATAKVLGDIITKAIVIDEHAIFQGKCDMNQETPAEKAKPAVKPIRTVKKSAKAALAEALKEVHEEAQKEEAASQAQENSEETAAG